MVRKKTAVALVALALAGTFAWGAAQVSGKSGTGCSEPQQPPVTAGVSRGGTVKPPVTTAEAKPARVLTHYGLGEDGSYRPFAMVEFDGPVVGAALAGKVASASGEQVTVRTNGGLMLEYAGLAGVFVKPGDTVSPGCPLGLTGRPVTLQVERGGVSLDPVALLWPEMSRFAAEAGTVEKERARLAAALRWARTVANVTSGQEGATGIKSCPAGLNPLFESAAGETGLDPRLLKAVAAAESGFDPKAVSSKGAVGIMQLMPGTAKELGVSDPFDPVQNVRAGARYLHRMLDRFGGDLELALAAYNAGPGVVEKYGGVPPFIETRRYVEKVLSIFRKAGGEAF